MCASMTPTYRYSPIVSSSMSLDQNHIQPSSSSSYPPYYDPHHHQPLNRLQTYHQHMITDAEKIAINPSGRSWNKEDKNDQVKEGSTKWMPSKMRMMMMVPDQTMNRFEDHNQKQPLLSSPLTHYNNNTCNISSCSSDQTYDIGVRVCADCHTTKTPLWRSGPTGPKSLCNACGIRQRKARRAMAAAAAVVSAPVRENEVQKKQEKEALLKKKMKACGGRKKVVLEDLAIRLSKNLSEQQVLFPQDEKEAAILLMALSYGLVRG